MKRLLFSSLLVLTCGSASAAALTYDLDANHTNVIATWSHFGFSNPSAHFGQADGTLVYDPDNVAASSVQVSLPLSGLNAFSKAFNEHLNSDDFFDSGKFPVATFKSTRVEAAGEGRLKVTGDLTIKDITRPVVLDVTLNKAGTGRDGQPRVGFDAAATLKRSDFGVGKFAPGVSDEVRLRITTEAGVPKPDADGQRAE